MSVTGIKFVKMLEDLGDFSDALKNVPDVMLTELEERLKSERDRRKRIPCNLEDGLEAWRRAMRIAGRDAT